MNALRRLTLSRLTRIAMLSFATLALGIASTPANAAAPATQRFEIDETSIDAALSQTCGFAVTVRAKGRLSIRTWETEEPRPGLFEILTVNVVLTAEANGKTYSYRDVGAEHVQVSPDLASTFSRSGLAFLAFAGVLKISLDTGEVILGPQRSLEEQVERICATLAPA